MVVVDVGSGVFVVDDEALIDSPNGVALLLSLILAFSVASSSCCRSSRSSCRRRRRLRFSI